MAQLTQHSLISRRRNSKRSRRLNLDEIDTALWAAYRRYDRSEVMEKLLQRFVAHAREATPRLFSRVNRKA